MNHYHINSVYSFIKRSFVGSFFHRVILVLRVVHCSQSKVYYCQNGLTLCLHRSSLSKSSHIKDNMNTNTVLRNLFYLLRQTKHFSHRLSSVYLEPRPYRLAPIKPPHTGLIHHSDVIALPEGIISSHTSTACGSTPAVCKRKKNILLSFTLMWPGG